jgi:alpha-ribazole phosphatase
MPPVEVVCHTGLLRTIQTAEHLFPGIPMQPVPRLAEFDFGDFETLSMKSCKIIRYMFAGWPISKRWPARMVKATRDFVARIRQGWLELASDWTGKTIEKAALVTHGGVIAVLMNDWFPGDQDLLDWQPACGSGYRSVFRLDIQAG